MTGITGKNDNSSPEFNELACERGSLPLVQPSIGSQLAAMILYTLYAGCVSIRKKEIFLCIPKKILMYLFN